MTNYVLLKHLTKTYVDICLLDLIWIVKATVFLFFKGV